MIDIDKIRLDFPILGREVHGRPLVYLDNGATAQKPASVIERINLMYSELNANVHRGVHFLSQECTTLYEAARENVRRLIGAESREEVIFTAGATASLNLVAHSFGRQALRAGDNVIVSQMEHHSNIVPWQLACEMTGATIRTLPFDEQGALEMDKLPELIDNRTKIIAITQASNVLGTRPELRRIIDMAHAHGACVVVDGCQGIVHGGVNVSELGCDFYAFSAHKLYGPTGVGALYGKRELLERMPPFMGGGDMVDTVEMERSTYAELPLKFEAGTANFVGAIGLSEAIDYLRRLEPSEIEAHERLLLARATERLTAIPGVRIYGTTPDKCAIVSFNVEGVHHYDIGMILDKLGVAIRTGTHCASPTMARYGVEGMCRASFALYNTEDEVDALIDAIEKAIRMLRR
ncbi:MAG: cysteine desulfurase [Rikenellaceae bacterium]|jgi:cysteine desulfurase/selenocysteine lyase|nr:cysteine desulfurase [Rikenellaceae bacterium]